MSLKTIEASLCDCCGITGACTGQYDMELHRPIFNICGRCYAHGCWKSYPNWPRQFCRNQLLTELRNQRKGLETSIEFVEERIKELEFFLGVKEK